MLLNEISKGMNRTGKLTVLIIAILLTTSNFSQSSDGMLRVGNKVPDISCDGMIGNCASLESLKGKLVLIEFWTTSNHSSMIDHAELEKVYSDFKNTSFKNGNGFEVYSVALDNSEEKWQLAKIRDNNSWPYSMCNTDKWNSQVAIDYKIQTIPRYYLLDGDGELIENLFLMKDLRQILTGYAQKVR